MAETKMSTPEFTEKCKANGCSSSDIAKVAALPGINFANILALLEQYGPQILTLILSLFGQAPIPPLIVVQPA